MLDYVDNLLRQLLIDRIDEISDESQVRFQPPDDDWRTYVSTLAVGGQPANALNVYLFDLRENRKLRSNERWREPSVDADGQLREVPAARRVDCHYLISAWSPATSTPAVEPTVDEHLLLYKAIAALNTADPLLPREIYAPNPLPPGFPSAIADAELPIMLLPPEGFPKLAEFWGTMGNNHRMKPAIYLQLTVPIVYPSQPAGTLVTTRISEYRVHSVAGVGEIWIEIGGRTLDSTNPQPDGSPSLLAGAWVLIETMAGIRLQDTRSDAAGRFAFAHLAQGDYRLRAWTENLAEITREIRVPSPTGEYELIF
ncbi:Pvc16 family protein [Lysobacter sp. CFH 32150]|uniref:Pvc16 family protein n=1 Tax=Lysobacter sp. CFH 32150 TaxID=2927128 RepID=UPI001FA70C6A|nr:Pvc16 family protein [Lysobacter sp. CFH 32150]MCI4567342.1 Pvc16 family protein [Lysobacter sp. CFH 32150]